MLQNSRSGADFMRSAATWQRYWDADLTNSDNLVRLPHPICTSAGPTVAPLDNPSIGAVLLVPVQSTVRYREVATHLKFS
jgi:hypothetical protein